MTHNEGNTKYRLQRLTSAQWLVRAETFVAGKPVPLTHATKFRDVGQAEYLALRKGVDELRPLIARDEALARGNSNPIPPDPVIDRGAERERMLREKAAETSRRAAEEAQAYREAAARQLDEANPMWGTF